VITAAVREVLATKFTALFPHLDERQRRLLLGAEAASLGRGGIAAVALAAGMSVPTVTKGLAEVRAGEPPSGRVRAAGGGRKRLTETDPGLAVALEALVDPETRGDPGSPLRWTTKSTRVLAEALTEAGHPCSHMRVAELLHELGYSLQGNAKQLEGKQHPDRDAQFRHINAVAGRYLRAGDPVVSVDTKKKELVGDDPGYKNVGKEWQPAKTPTKVGTHDFPKADMPKAVPYGVYDLGANTGWVSVGQDGDTAAFAVQTLRRWWTEVGQPSYPNARRLLITADAGGSNSYRIWLWKVELAKFATETGLAITVCHFPPGTSKWNKIEHRMFSAITSNWRGRPLTSHQVIVELIGATRNTKGLTIRAELDTNTYPRGIKVSNTEMAEMTKQLSRNKFHGEWNYSLKPARPIKQT
jgi:transposase